MSRCFVALELDAESLALCAEAQRAIDPLGARKTKPESLHVTIKFLGEVSVESARAVLDALHAFAGTKAPDLGVAKLDAFPTPARGKIVVLSCADPTGAAFAIAKRADEAAFELASVEREERAFRTHVTLARSRSAVDVRAIAKRFGDRACGHATRIVLYESALGPEGPKYTELGAHVFS